MAGKLHIIVGSHFHVPYGAGDEEFEKIYALRLRPFLSSLFKFPKIQGTLHCSGPLFNWLERMHPEFLMFMGDLVSAKQLEILGGGFYEPLFSVISQQDRIGQVELLTTYLRKRFGKKPQGCWISALDWEQSLVVSLVNCGMAYTFLSERQFALAGLSGKDLYSPCISEDQGKLIAVFPVQGRIGDPVWENKPRAVLKKIAAALPAGRDWLVSVFPGPGRVLPESPDQTPGGLKGQEGVELFWQEFFEGLSSCDSLLEFTTPGRYIKGRRDLSRACFPNSMEDDGSGKRLFLRQYLLEYPEANRIYAKMIFSHTLANQLRGDKSRKRTALEELWKAQGIDVFYPAENGGIYRPSIRRSAYKALLEAEKITREAGDFIPSLMNFDFDFDSEIEYLFRGERINCYIQLLGAGIFELDYLPNSWNYLDTFDRSMPGSNGSRNRKASFTDRFLPAGFSPKDILSGRNDGIRDCGEERFELREMDKARGKASFYLPPSAAETHAECPFRALSIEKSYQLRRDILVVSYTLANPGKEETGFLFVSSIDLSFPGEGENFLRVLKGAEVLTPGRDGVLEKDVLTVKDTDLLKFQDLKNEAIISLGADRPLNGWIFPRRTAMESRPGPGLYQSSCVTLVFPTHLKPGESWNLAFTLKFTH
jgi:hypothetical protein